MGLCPRHLHTLVQPVYTGYICSETYNLNWLEGQHEGLISLETFDKVQKRRKGTAKAPKAWNHRRDQAKQIISSGQQQIKETEKQIESLLTRIMATTNATVINTYEDKIGELEHQKLLLTEKLQNQAEPKGSFEEKLEPVLQFLANPYKLWQTGHITLRQTVLKLAFADTIPYDRNKGPRTPQIALPFKALRGDSNKGVFFGAAEKTRTSTGYYPTATSTLRVYQFRHGRTCLVE